MNHYTFRFADLLDTHPRPRTLPSSHSLHAEDLHAARTALIQWLDRNGLDAEYATIGRGAGHFIDLSC